MKMSFDIDKDLGTSMIGIDSANLEIKKNSVFPA